MIENKIISDILKINFGRTFNLQKNLFLFLNDNFLCVSIIFIMKKEKRSKIIFCVIITLFNKCEISNAKIKAKINQGIIKGMNKSLLILFEHKIYLYTYFLQ